MLEKITWPVVAVIGMILTSITILGVTHVDATIIISVVTVLGLGGLLGVGSQIRTNVNGNLSKLIDHLANSAPITPDTTTTTSTTTTAPPEV